MNFIVKKYNKEDKDALFALIKSEGDEWKDYHQDNGAINKYTNVLNHSIVYVVYESDNLVGYIRANDDFGYGIYINDLLVHKDYRGKSYGKALIEQICKDFSGTIYVRSDVDEYYKKQGYSEVAGSIIIIRQ